MAEEPSEPMAPTKMRMNDNTLTKEEQKELLRSFLPACQPQEGSPANTFTRAELDDLKTAFPDMQIGSRSEKKDDGTKLDILKQWEAPSQDGCEMPHPQQDGSAECDCKPASSKEDESETDWHGAPRFHRKAYLAQNFREKVRKGEFTGPTNGVCPGFMQCNLVVLPQGPVAFDFLLFCQRNPKACPLIDVCDVGSPHAPGVAKGADLRTDVPK